MRILGNNKGMALLLTLSIISLLVAFSLELNRKVRSAVFTVASARDRTALHQMALSGIHAAMAVLVEDKMKSETDTLQEDWSDPEIIDEMMAAFPFEKGRVRVHITDELSKIQVNAVVKFPDKNTPNNPQMLLWERFLINHIAEDDHFEQIEPVTIINSLKDWIDSGDDDAITGLTGAESDYYEDIESAYGCRNGRIPHLSDLVWIRGVSRELYYGVGESTGISEYLTVHGIQIIGDSDFAYPGRININTARLPVLTALMPIGSEDFAQALVDYREEMSGDEYVNDISNPTWYTDVPGISALDGQELAEFQGLITTASDIYRIEAEAEHGDSRQVLNVVVQREQDRESGKWKCRILSLESL